MAAASPTPASSAAPSRPIMAVSARRNSGSAISAPKAGTARRRIWRDSDREDVLGNLDDDGDIRETHEAEFHHEYRNHVIECVRYPHVGKGFLGDQIDRAKRYGHRKIRHHGDKRRVGVADEVQHRKGKDRNRGGDPHGNPPAEFADEDVAEDVFLDVGPNETEDQN